MDDAVDWLKSSGAARCERYKRLDSLFSVMITRAFAGNLTVAWREAHMNELLREMEQQARYLATPSPEART